MTISHHGASQEALEHGVARALVVAISQSTDERVAFRLRNGGPQSQADCLLWRFPGLERLQLCRMGL